MPTVFEYAVASNTAFGHPYLLMEKLPGHALPTLHKPWDGVSEWKDTSPEDLRLAEKVHQQLTDVMIELGKHALRTYSHFKFSGNTKTL